MTVAELKKMLENYSDDTKVYITGDGYQSLKPVTNVQSVGQKEVEIK